MSLARRGMQMSYIENRKWGDMICALKEPHINRLSHHFVSAKQFARAQDIGRHIYVAEICHVMLGEKKNFSGY